ncbi:MAG TPA: hypothetical protein VGJ51_17095, partial [Candidatus Angelobacter sp.]
PESERGRVEPENYMIVQEYSNGNAMAVRVSEARYSYYRRCQVFRRNGEQCKAPAETGSHICYAHAGQQATAFRRDLERRIVLAEAVAEMRRRGRLECEMADLFTDFKGINMTLAVTARAVIAGRIDCKTAGRLLVHLQTMSKLLWMMHQKRTSTTEARRHGEQPKMQEEAQAPQICADERRLNREQELPVLPTPQAAATATLIIGRGIDGEEPRMAFEAKAQAIPEKPRSLLHGKWEQTRAA